MNSTWRDVVTFGFAAMLFVAAILANLGESSKPQLRGAWVAQVMR